MTWETWSMMLIVLPLNWGGFIGLLAYGVRRENRNGRGNAVLNSKTSSSTLT